MKDKDFWSSIEATEEEKKKGEYYLRERGLEEHFNALKYLQSFRKSDDGNVTYRQVATVLRYDKRIRRCLFKYIGVVEERLRAHFLDSFRDDKTKLIRTKAFDDLLDEFNCDFYSALTHLRFSQLLFMFKKQEESFKTSVFPGVDHIKKNLDALIALRNLVFHNRFLLGSLEFKGCFINGTKSASLYANIKNLHSFLDENTKRNLFDEINACSAPHKTSYENQVDWELVEDAKLSL